MARIPDIIDTKAQVDTIFDAFLAIGDGSIFTRHIEAMSDEASRSSRAIMRGSGNELAPLDEFLSLTLNRKIITIDDVVSYATRYSNSLKQSAA
ncbi:hypothetical protein [Aminobacter sp. MET-1]|uniref:hypothetical protein n=1 Tax=Aminobacter sp. MET-1 TaxID=2951085 RepID=UPI002269DAB0|nr:hypothetical protein [Aminobacter sp. MET-1]MCX8571184.1 hypothetical protein [Aminobacter sp. MET-1]MCX8573318.1 hypothetical protein [Aminobacter sp. MET-1]